MAFDGTLVASGVNTILGYGLEGTFNSVEAEDWTGMVDELIVGRDDNVYQHRGISNKRSPTSMQTVATNYPISIRGKVDSGWQWLMAGGYCSGTTDPNIGLFRGALHLADTETKVYLPSWTLKRTFANESVDLSFKGITFDSATFSCDLDGPWTFDLSGIGKSQGTDTSSGVAIPSTMFGSWNTTVNVDVDAAAFSSGDDITGLNNVSFSINQNMVTRNEFGTTAPVAIRQPKAGLGDVTLSLTRGFVDDDLWTQISDGGVNSFEIIITDGTDTYTHEFDGCYANTTTETTNTDGETVDKVDINVTEWNLVCADSITYVKYA